MGWRLRQVPAKMENWRSGDSGRELHSSLMICLVPNSLRERRKVKGKENGK